MNVLISGGSGMLGGALKSLLEVQGHEVRILSRNPKNRKNYFFWNIDSGEIDNQAVHGIDAIVHLAGSSVAQGRWTKKRKNEILDSRIESAKLLYKALEESNQTIQTFLTASGVGYYGSFPSGIVDESHPVGPGFLANVCEQWEEVADQFEHRGAKIYKCRIGIVLSRKGGFLIRLEPLLRNNIGSKLGSGKQITSWIHIEDLTRAMSQMLNSDLEPGIYNMVSPNASNHSALMDALAKAMDKRIWLPNIPQFALKLVFGELTTEILANQHIIPKHLQDQKFQFTYPNIESALGHLYS